MNYKIGIYEKALPANLDWSEKLRIAKENNYDFLEISIDETFEKLSRLDWSFLERRRLLSTMQQIGLPISSMCLSGHRKYPLGSHDPNIRQKSLEIARKAIDLACDLGIRVIQLAGYDVYYEESDEFTRKEFISNLNKVVEMASSKGVLLGFETMETEFMDTAKKAMHYVKLINSPYLGVYPDCGNLNNASLKYGHDLIADIEEARGHIVAMHLKETKEGHYRNMLFGQGKVDFERVISNARKLGINRFVTEFWHLGSDDYLNDIKEQNNKMRIILDRLYK